MVGLLDLQLNPLLLSGIIPQSATLPTPRLDIPPLPLRPGLRRGRGSELATQAVQGARASRPPLAAPQSSPEAAGVPSGAPAEAAGGLANALSALGLFGGSGGAGGLLDNVNLPLALAGVGALSTTGESLTPQNPFAAAMQGLVQGFALDDRRANRDLERRAFELEIADREAERQRREQRSEAVETAIATLPPEVQALARAAPEGFINAQIEGMFASPDLPSGMRTNPETGMPEWIPGFLEGQAFVRAAGRSAQTVVLPPQEREFEATAGRLGAETVNTLREEATSAQGLLGLVDQVEDAFERVGDTGTLTEAKAAATNALRSLGLEDVLPQSALEDARSVQEIRGLLAQITGQNIQVLGAGTGLSDSDREFAQTMFARLSNDPEANARIIANTREQARSKIDSFESAQAHVRENGNLTGWTPPALRGGARQQEVGSLSVTDIQSMSESALRALVDQADSLTDAQAEAAAARWRQLGLPQ